MIMIILINTRTTFSSRSSLQYIFVLESARHAVNLRNR
jgi:hypothetical protein